MALKDAVERLNLVGNEVAESVGSVLTGKQPNAQADEELVRSVESVNEKLENLVTQIKNVLNPPAPPAASNMAEPEIPGDSVVDPQPIPEEKPPT